MHLKALRSAGAFTSLGLAVLGLTLAGCGSSSGGGGSASAGSAITVGVLTSLTGPTASSFNTTEKGVEARFALQNAQGGVNGHQLEYVMADDQSSTQGAQTATQNLVENKHVFAVLTVSATFFAAESFAKAHEVPVIGAGFDGSEWADKANANLFADAGVVNYGTASNLLGLFFKSQGATKVAAVGNAGTPSSAGAAVGAKLSAQSVGLTAPYLNTSVPLGSTDVGAIAIGIKNSGADALYLPTTPNTAFALVAALDQLGVHMKAIVLATGYGGDLLSQPPVLQLAQGVDFEVGFTPFEQHTPAVETMLSALTKYAGVTGEPTFAEQQGWFAADAFIRGLQAAGSNPTQASFSSGLRAVTGYDAGGLDANKVDFSDYAPSSGCAYFTKLQGNAFVIAPGTEPVCGHVIPGSTGY